jgi:phage repressor protein C with HTH and peptisase S24 domain
MSFSESEGLRNYVPRVPTDAAIGKRIKQVREDVARLSQSAFASKLGKVTRGAVGNWERGLGIKRDNLREIAERFGVSFEWLALGRGDMSLTSEKTHDGHAVPNAVIGDKLTNGGHYIPLYGHAVGGLDGEFVLNGNKLDDITAPPNLSPANGAYAVTCAGESMEPRFFDGEIVFVDPTHRVRRGDFVVAQIRNPNEGNPPLAYIKRFVRHNDAELILEQYNPGKELRFGHADVVSVHFIAASRFL